MTAPTGRLVATVLAVLAITLATHVTLTAGPVAAHSSEAGTTPEEGEVVLTAPRLVEVRFDSPLLDVGAAMVVRHSDGTSIVLGTPRVDRQSISIDVDPAAPPGDYSVAYRVVAEDGHAIESSFGYTVSGGDTAPTQEPVEATEMSAPGDTAAAEPSSTPPYLLIVGGVLVLLLAGAGAIALRR